MNTIAAIATAAKEWKLRFLLAGGHAVILHGFPRNTFDLDLAIDREDLKRWRQLLTTMGYGLLREGPAFAQFNPGNRAQLPLDLMLINGATFEKMLAEAVPGPAGVDSACVVSLKHLLAMKCHAIKHGHAGRILKDADDVIRLVEVNRIDVNQPEWRELILKFGTPELHEKLARITQVG